MKSSLSVALLAAVSAVFSGWASPGFGLKGVTVGLPEPWVDVDSLERLSEGAEHPAGGVNHLLVKHHFNPAANAVYSRYAMSLETESGVDANSTLYWNFDPDFEEIQLHWIRIHREGETVDILPRSNIEVVDARTEVSSWFYDDSKDIRIILDDIRVGDVLDYSFTRVGSNPVIGKRFSDSAALGFSVPVKRIEVRLDWPLDEEAPRYLTFPDVVPPEVTEWEEVRTFRWVVEEAPAYLVADGAPAGYGPPWVEFSDWESWGEVARWAADLYHFDASLPDWVAKAVDGIKERELSDREAATEVLELIQDSIRYVAIPVGPHSYQPYSPAEIADRRYGDCKDMSQLVVLALRELGIDADPVLVNTVEVGNVSRWLPSPQAFDHVVVGAEIDGLRVWMDPTYSYQGGVLPHRFFPDYGVGLRVTERTNGLEYGVGPQGFEDSLVDSVETFDFSSYRNPVRLQVRTLFSGDEADFMRERIATDGKDSLEREYANYYSELYGGVREKEPILFEDDRNPNRIEIQEEYLLPSLFGKNPDEAGFRLFVADQIADRLPIPMEKIREEPYRLYLPNHARQSIRLMLPDSSVFEPEEHRVETEWFVYSLRVYQEGKLLSLDHELKVLRSLVPASRIDDYVQAVNEVLALLEYQIEVAPDQKAGGLMAGLIEAMRQPSGQVEETEVKQEKPGELKDYFWAVAAGLVLVAFAVGVFVGKKIS